MAVPSAAAAAPGQLRAGAASVDATWHVGASAGQYASDGSFVGVHGVDPHTHSTRRSASYGVQSRLEVRALVIEEAAAGAWPSSEERRELWPRAIEYNRFWGKYQERTSREIPLVILEPRG